MKTLLRQMKLLALVSLGLFTSPIMTHSFGAAYLTKDQIAQQNMAKLTPDTHTILTPNFANEQKLVNLRTGQETPKVQQIRNLINEGSPNPNLDHQILDNAIAEQQGRVPAFQQSIRDVQDSSLRNFQKGHEDPITGFGGNAKLNPQLQDIYSNRPEHRDTVNSIIAEANPMHGSSIPPLSPPQSENLGLDSGAGVAGVGIGGQAKPAVESQPSDSGTEMTPVQPVEE